MPQPISSLTGKPIGRPQSQAQAPGSSSGNFASVGNIGSYTVDQNPNNPLPYHFAGGGWSGTPTPYMGPGTFKGDVGPAREATNYTGKMVDPSVVQQIMANASHDPHYAGYVGPWQPGQGPQAAAAPPSTLPGATPINAGSAMGATLPPGMNPQSQPLAGNLFPNAQQPPPQQAPFNTTQIFGQTGYAANQAAPNQFDPNAMQNLFGNAPLPGMPAGQGWGMGQLANLYGLSNAS